MLNFWGISFHLYGLVLGLGIIMAREVVMKVAREWKLDLKILDKIVIVGVIGGIVGARLYHVLDNFGYYSENVVKIFLIWEGGLGIWGAIAGGLLALQFSIFSFSRFHRGSSTSSGQFSKKREILDLGAIGLPLGQAIGRWGNFFNGEIVGRNGEPLFFYESLSTFILFLIIYKLRDKRRGRLFGIYLLGYGIIRLVLEGLRAPGDAWMIGGVSVSTVLSLVSIILGLIWISPRSMAQF